MRNIDSDCTYEDTLFKINIFQQGTSQSPHVNKTDYVLRYLTWNHETSSIFPFFEPERRRCRLLPHNLLSKCSWENSAMQTQRRMWAQPAVTAWILHVRMSLRGKHFIAQLYVYSPLPFPSGVGRYNVYWQLIASPAEHRCKWGNVGQRGVLPRSDLRGLVTIALLRWWLEGGANTWETKTRLERKGMERR